MKQLLLFILSLCILSNALGQTLTRMKDPTTEKYGYKEGDNIEWSIEPIYKYALGFEDNLAVVHDGECQFVINLHGKKVSPNFKYISFRESGQPFICKDLKGKYNLYDTQFKPLCKESYDDISDYKITVPGFVVKKNGLSGVIDYEGNVLIPPMYKELQFECYYIIGTKRREKDGIAKSTIDKSLIVAKNDKDNYVVINYANEVIVPDDFETDSPFSRVMYRVYDKVSSVFVKPNNYRMFRKVVKRPYNSVLRPFLQSSRPNEILSMIENAQKRSRERNIELAKIYPTDLPKIEKTIVKKVKNGQAFFKGNKQKGKVYQAIYPENKCYLIKNGGKYGIANLLGDEIVCCQYDNIMRWNTFNGSDIYVVEQKDKYGLIKDDGTILTDIECEMIFLPQNNTGIAYKDDLFWLVGSNGVIVTRHGFDIIDYKSDRIYGQWMGHNTEVLSNGTEVTPIMKQIFDEAYYTPSDEVQKKYDRYMFCVLLDPTNRLGYTGLAYNNIGVIFDELGDEDKAYEYYKLGWNLGDQNARENVQRILKARRLRAVRHTLNEISQTLNDLSTTLNSIKIKENNTQTTNPYYNSQTTTQVQGQEKKKMPLEYYQNMYDMFERSAKSQYELLETATNIVHRTCGSQSLRDIQRKMKKIRTDAHFDGHTITQSRYETIKTPPRPSTSGN